MARTLQTLRVPQSGFDCVPGFMIILESWFDCLIFRFFSVERQVEATRVKVKLNYYYYNPVNVEKSDYAHFAF